jgi:hypothetical protein
MLPVAGSWNPAAIVCALGDGLNGFKVDHIELHDGSYAPEGTDVTEVYSGYAEPYSLYARCQYYTETQLQAALDNDEVCYVDRREAYYDASDCCTLHDGSCAHWGDVVVVSGDNYYPDDDDVHLSQDGTYFLTGDDDYIQIGRDYYHVDECHYCEGAGEWVYGDRGECSCSNTSNRIHGYHENGRPTLYRGASPWLVGFEVEKVSLDGRSDEGDPVEETDLFVGWETDSSCGVEGITHAYDPLDPAMAALFVDHVAGARGQLNEPTDGDCGGHLSITHSYLSSEDLFQRFRDYAGLWYALYKGRLLNQYCYHNKALLYCSHRRGTITRKSKIDGIEVRLPSAVHNWHTLMRRFDLVAATCRSIDERLSFNGYLLKATPIVLEMYSGDRRKAAKVLRMARHMQRWINTGTEHRSIARYVQPN